MWVGRSKGIWRSGGVFEGVVGYLREWWGIWRSGGVFEGVIKGIWRSKGIWGRSGVGGEWGDCLKGFEIEDWREVGGPELGYRYKIILKYFNTWYIAVLYLYMYVLVYILCTISQIAFWVIFDQNQLSRGSGEGRWGGGGGGMVPGLKIKMFSSTLPIYLWVSWAL